MKNSPSLDLKRSLGRWLVCGLLLSLSSALSADDPADVDRARRDKVLQSISRAQEFLIRQQLPGGSWSSGVAAQYPIGVPSLVTLSLLNSGLAPDHPAITKGLEYLRRQQDPNHTYEAAMMIMVLTAADDPGDRGRIARMAAWLEKAQIKAGDGKGAWGYGDEANWHDNSNTQFAILGLREAAHAGIPIDRKTWQRAAEHFQKTQNGELNGPTGAGWGYQGAGAPTGSMTVAGIASMTICAAMLADDAQDTTPDGQIECCGQTDNSMEKSIQAGVRWIARNYQIRGNPGGAGWRLYYLYGLERAGRFTGRRFFANHDWYREGVDDLVAGQNPRDGSWVSESEQEPVIGTALGLLFVSKGLSPVLVNKIKYGTGNANGDELAEAWNVHPRDISQVVDFLSGQPRWPKLMTWQVLDLNVATNDEGVSALLQAPVQYLSGTESLETIQGRQLELLREYIAQGGFLFAVQNCDNSEFDRTFRDLVRRLFDGQYELRKLAPTHDVYRSEFLFGENPPVLEGVDFGCRTAIMYAPFDHACRWQKWMKHDPEDRHPAVKSQIAKSMQLATNVIAYATGREVQDKLKRQNLLTEPNENRINRGRLSIARL
ncbi:MAG: DUF4159 domain-containing protein, partial [Planctomycetaceae bacterium]|nr:DUF4159 domain-containing protein [Planctomycetaceae bacterium]